MAIWKFGVGVWLAVTVALLGEHYAITPEWLTYALMAVALSFESITLWIRSRADRGAA